MRTDTRATIRSVAIELFTARGYEQTSLREIAERVGLTKASLYYHYPSKQALLLDIIQPLVDRWRETSDGTQALRHTPRNVRTVLLRCIDALLENRGAAGLFVRDTAAVVVAVAPIWEELLELNGRLFRWLAGPRPSRADQIRAIAAIEALGTAVSSAAYLPDLTDDELRDTLLDAAAAVLRLRRPAGPGSGQPGSGQPGSGQPGSGQPVFEPARLS